MIILIIIWLFKITKNAKNEPTNRSRYIDKDPGFYYEEGEFCYDNYEKYILKGAFDTFGLRIKRIKKYSRAVLATIFISLGSMIMVIIFSELKDCNENFASYFIGLFSFFYVISDILCLAFAIVLAHDYFKSNFSDFEKFSKCRYLMKQFKKDYNFIFIIKDEFKMPFIFILFFEFSNFMKKPYNYEIEDENYEQIHRINRVIHYPDIA
jgi:hypothetical protein